jgi:hypothetical protein
MNKNRLITLKTQPISKIPTLKDYPEANLEQNITMKSYLSVVIQSLRVIKWQFQQKNIKFLTQGLVV